MHYNMELPDFWLVVWVILVLDFVFLFSSEYPHASVCINGG